MPEGKGYLRNPADKPAKKVPVKKASKMPKNQLQGKGLGGVTVTRVATAKSSSASMKGEM